MTNLSMLAGLGSSTGLIARGRVNLLLNDESLVVDLESGDEHVICDLLYSSQRPPEMSPGDLVLVWVSPYSGDNPVVLGCIGPSHASASVKSQSDQTDELVIEATKNLTLKCGEGSITIRQDGKILIKGKDLVSHAQRMNRIKGGSVSIN